MSRKLLEHVEQLSALLAAGEPVVAVTLVALKGHVPQDLGAKAIVGSDGLRHGTIGGGRIEARAVALAVDLIRDQMREPRIDSWDLQRDIGMTCGGSATLLFEPHFPEAWEILVFGAGHIGQALVPLLGTFACRLTCVDHRGEWLSRLAGSEHFKVIHTDDYATQVQHASRGAFYVICTKGHDCDLPVLKAVLRRGDAKYVGVIGSVTKGRSLRAALLRDGFSDEQTRQFRTPMGLPLGSNSPAEIAVSIAAELLAVRDGKLLCTVGPERVAEYPPKTPLRTRDHLNHCQID